MPEYIPGTGTEEAVQEETRVERPRRFRVLLHNDDYTTMEFVVEILEQVFRKAHSEAVGIMHDVHENGMGVAGVYVKAIAEAKVLVVHRRARRHGYPLRCSVDPE
jgi:ATP-dependent Clp protease adaptor protein ClpS